MRVFEGKKMMRCQLLYPDTPAEGGSGLRAAAEEEEEEERGGGLPLFRPVKTLRTAR